MGAGGRLRNVNLLVVVMGERGRERGKRRGRRKRRRIGHAKYYMY